MAVVWAPEGWRLRLPADPELAGTIAALAVAEHARHPSLTFRLHMHAGTLEVHVSVPDEARPLAAELFDARDARAAAG